MSFIVYVIVYLFVTRPILSVTYSELYVICILYIMCYTEIRKSFLWYFLARIVWILLSFAKFHVKHINFSCTSYSLTVILNCQISQGSVATQIRWRGSLCHRHTERVSLGICQWKSVFIRRSHDQNSKGLFFIETRCIFIDFKNSFTSRQNDKSKA